MNLIFTFFLLFQIGIIPIVKKVYKETPSHSSERDIIFSSIREGNEDIYLMDNDGENVMRLTNTLGEGKKSRTPEWSPDGNSIAFQSNRDGVSDIYILQLDNLQISRLTNSPNDGYSQHPAWSPDGMKIAYSAYLHNKNRLFSINIDGSDCREITPIGLDAKGYLNPCWSPDGRAIAFLAIGETEQEFEIWTMDVDGSNHKQLTNNNYYEYEFDYSPDGKNIVFDSEREGNYDIYVMNADGSQVHRITQHKGIDTRPKWSSDGSKIVFHSARNGSIPMPTEKSSNEEIVAWFNQFEIYRIDADGSNLKRLTSNQSPDFHPDW